MTEPAVATSASPAETSPEGPLTGVRIVELGTLIAGPFGGRLLGDLGAEVIKIERPGAPDPLRQWGQAMYRGRSLWWAVQSRNKKCVTLDLRSERGKELLLQLVEKSDVVVENFRPGTLEKWDLGYDRLVETNPRIILTRVSGYGQTGPYAKRAGYASVAEAMGGLRHINGFPDQAPPRFGISLGDSLAGMFSALGTLAALYRRDARSEDRGQVVDISLMEACFALLEGTVPEYDRAGIVRQPTGTTLPGVSPSNTFCSKDGKWVIIAANQDTLFRRLCEVIGRPELAHDPRYATHNARNEHEEELDRIIADWAAEHDADEIDRVMNEAGVVCGPIYTVADIFEDPQFQARDMLLPHEDPELGSFIGPGVVPKFSRTPGGVRWAGTGDEGSHNRDVYGGLLGVSDEELDRLEREGLV
jgi:formyl-CoA transferase